MNINLFILFFFFILSLFSFQANNIQKIKLLHADYAIQNQNKPYWLLQGNIYFQHQEYKIKCDYVKYYKNNHKFIGIGNIHIIYLNNIVELYSKYIEYDINKNLYKVSGDPTIYTKNSKLTGNIIIYNDTDKLFKSFGNSCFNNQKIKLISDQIEYNMINCTAYYNNGGNIYFDQNIFFSQKGVYFILDEKIFFKNSYLTNQKYTFFSEKIIYNIHFDSINFIGPTLIINNNKTKNFIYANIGIHYFNENITLVKNNNVGIIYFNNNIIHAKNIYIDNQNYYGYIKNNIWIEIINKQQYFIGGYGEINKNFFLLINNPILINLLYSSKIFIVSDTFIYKKNKKQNYYILYAYHINTKFDNISIASNYMIYNNNIIKYYTNAQISVNKNNKIIADLISLIFNQAKTINKIEIQYNTLFINQQYNLGNLNLNYILASIMQILFKNNTIKKIIFHQGVKTLSYTLYKGINNKKIFSNINIINSHDLIFYINKSFIKLFFLGQAKSMIVSLKIIDNKKLLNIINFFKKHDIIISISVDQLIKYINIKENIKQNIEYIKQNLLEKLLL